MHCIKMCFLMKFLMEKNKTKFKKSIMWYSGMVRYYKKYEKNNITEIIEVGPKNVLTRLIQKIEPSIKTKSFDKISDVMGYGMQKD